MFDFLAEGSWFSPREAKTVMNGPLNKRTLQRYAVMLLFQFRVQYGRKSNKRRICETRLIHINARNISAAIEEAKKYGRRASHSYTNNTGGTVHFEFVGLVDLRRLGLECQEGELWYRISEMIEPMERRKMIIPSDDQLLATANERASGRSRSVQEC